MKIDLSVYLVLDARLCNSPEGMCETVKEALKGGVTVVQLRAPEWKKDARLKAARLLRQVLEGTGVPLIINDDADVALLAGADGVHVGQDDLPPDDVRDLLGDKAIVGLSVGNLSEMSRLSASVDYLGVGPVYPTATKADAGAACGLDGLHQICENTNLPVVAIGGINASNARDAIEHGAQGVAVVSAICGKKNVRQATEAIAQAIQIG